LSLENQFIYPIPRGSKLIFFAPLGVGVNEENQLMNRRRFISHTVLLSTGSFLAGNVPSAFGYMSPENTIGTGQNLYELFQNPGLSYQVVVERE
jgi:hypothetical protein